MMWEVAYEKKKNHELTVTANNQQTPCQHQYNSRAGGSPGTGVSLASELCPGVGIEPWAFPHITFSRFPLMTSLPKVPSAAWAGKRAD